MHLTADDCRLVMLLIETSQLDEDKEAAWELHHRIQRSRGMSIVTHDEAKRTAFLLNVHQLDDYITQQRTREAGQQAEIERLRYERDHARARYENTVSLLVGIHSLLYPSPTTLPDGRVMVFRPKSPDPHEVLQELSNRIRALPDEIARAALNTEGAKG